MNCKCNDRRHSTMTALWHSAYCNWYDHDRAGHRLRATAWGWIADRLVRIGDRIGWGEA